MEEVVSVGDIRKISQNYPIKDREASLTGIEICITNINRDRRYIFEATVIEGHYRGQKWLFLENEVE